MTKKEVDEILGWANSCENIPMLNSPRGITRIHAFLSIKPVLKGKLYWYALSDAYTGSDNLFHYKEDIKFAFEKNEPDKHFLMNKHERKYLESLPKIITIYRGMTKEENKSNNYGISWSLDKKIAEFYAYEYNRNYATQGQPTLVKKLKIPKQNAIAYLNERTESEIIYIHQKHEWLDTRY